jgi:hypothetical protein
MIYELVTPSDPITFRADRHDIAFAAAVILGRGKAGVTAEDRTDIPAMLWLCDEKTIDETIAKQTGGLGLAAFQRLNALELAACFESFSYGRTEDRRDYDAAIEAITDPEKLAEFKAKHDDNRRTSMSEWVKAAWQLGERHRKLAADEPVEFAVLVSKHPNGSTDERRFEKAELAEGARILADLRESGFGPDHTNLNLYPEKA